MLKNIILVLQMRFKKTELEVISTVGKRNTGTKVRFTPDAQFFDTVKFSATKLRHNLRSKAVLCPGLEVNFYNEIDDTTDKWMYQEGLKDYLSMTLDGLDNLPEKPFVVNFSSDEQQLNCSLAWTQYTH